MKIYKCKYGNGYPVDKECEKDCCEKCNPCDNHKDCHCETTSCITCYGNNCCKCIDGCTSCIRPVDYEEEYKNYHYDE